MNVHDPIKIIYTCENLVLKIYRKTLLKSSYSHNDPKDTVLQHVQRSNRCIALELIQTFMIQLRFVHVKNWSWKSTEKLNTGVEEGCSFEICMEKIFLHCSKFCVTSMCIMNNVVENMLKLLLPIKLNSKEM